METSPEAQPYLTLLGDRDAWNRWKIQHPDVSLNLTRVVLNGVNLNDSDVRDINFTRANLIASKFHKADCRRTCFAGANLKGADLSGADLRAANLKWANLTRSNLRRANLSGANLSGADLTGADLTGADLQGATLDGVKFTGALMPDGSLYGVVQIEPVEASEPNVAESSQDPAAPSETTLTGSIPLDQLLSHSIIVPGPPDNVARLASTNGNHYGDLAPHLRN